MAMQLRTPEAPATKRQLWLLHLLTGDDTRSWTLTMQEASDRIGELKSTKAGGNGNGNRPLVNPHATAIQRDKQLRTQQSYDKSKPKPKPKPVVKDQVYDIEQPAALPRNEERIQAAVADCVRNDPKVAALLAENPQAPVRDYDFDCGECFLNLHGLCSPAFRYAGSIHKSLDAYGFVTGQVESISVSCKNHLPLLHSKHGYCHRPARTRCQRKGNNKCYACQYLKEGYHHLHNRSEYYRYEPTLQERIDGERFWIQEFQRPRTHDTSYDYTQAIRDNEARIALLEKIKGG